LATVGENNDERV